MTNNTVVYIAHNGNWPYKVTLDNGKATIEKQHIKYNNGTQFETYVPCIIVSYIQFFINEKNNTLLLVEDLSNCVFIGAFITRFTPRSPIVSFFSNTGMNQVEYPYAIDLMKNVYLLTESAVIYDNDVIPTNPHCYFYTNSRISANMTFGITGLLIKDSPEEYHLDLTYTPRPKKNWDFLMMRGNEIFLKTLTDEPKPLTRDEYIKINENFGEIMKFAKIDNETILHH